MLLMSTIKCHVSYSKVDEHMVDPPSPSSDAVAALVKELRAQLGMALFGVDVIVNIGTHALTVIDINIFPGSAGVHSDLHTGWHCRFLMRSFLC